MPELSREAMQLLELGPQWELRPEYRREAPEPSPVSADSENAPAESTPLTVDVEALTNSMMILGLANTSSGRALWAALAKAMVGMGFPRTMVEASLILESPQLDRAVQEILKRQPANLICFGDHLIGEIQTNHPATVLTARTVLLDSLEHLISTPKKKADLWSALHRLRQELGFHR